MAKTNFQPTLQAKDIPLFAAPMDGGAPVLTVADRYVPREIYETVFGVPKHWPGKRWIHLVHNWRTGGSSLTAILSVNVHDSYLKVGHPFTRDGWPVDYSLHPLQITRADQLCQWIQAQPSPGILAGHTYAGMAQQLGLADSDLWVTLREPAARLNSGLLRFHRKSLNSDHPDGGYVGKTKGHTFKTAAEIEAVARQELGHELNGMCRRIAGYAMLSPRAAVKPGDDLETCQELDERPVDQACFDLAMDHLKSSQWIYLTEQVIPSLLLLEHTYNLRPLIHPCSNLVHNPQWNGAGITRLQESLLTKHRGLLESLNPWDVKLYKEAQQLFWKRWKEADIDPSRLQARRLLQSKPMLPADLVSQPKKAYEYMRFQAAKRSKSSGDNITKWLSHDINNAAFHKSL